MSVTVIHEPERHRFIAHLDVGDGVLLYNRPDGRTIDLEHTEVPTAARGQGVADLLTKAAIDYARANKLRVIPSCPFVRKWLARHPEERDVLADPTG